MSGRAKRSTSIRRDQMVKPIDAWWTVLLIDPLATRIVPPLSRVRALTPTRITVVAHVLGLISAALYATDHLLVAAAVFEIRFVADCVDGKLARVTGRSSTFGQLLDTFGDRVLLVLNVVALGWGRAPLAVLLVAASYPLHFHLLEARAQLLARAGSDKPSDRLILGGWGGALARRRLYPIPTSVDVEHLLLVAAPVAWALGVDVIAAALWATAAYFVAQTARYGLGLLRAASAVDRAASVDPSSVA